MIKLTLEDKRLDPFRDLKGRDALNDGTMVVESAKVIAKLLDSDAEPIALLATEAALKTNVFDSSRFETIYTLAEKDISTLIGYHYHQGVIALAKRPAMTELSDLGPRILILNSLTSPENVGALIRTAAGLGITDILFDRETCHPHVRRAARVSMGSVFFMRWHQTANLVAAIDSLKSRGIAVVGGANDPGSISIHDYDWQASGHAILIGSEGHGIFPEVRDACSKLVFIPMNDRVAHFNAAAAGAMMMYEMKRILRF